MINKYLLSLLMIGMLATDLFAYVNDSGECMLMENITTMLEEYRSYKDKISQLTEQSKGYDGKIRDAQSSAASARESVEKINNSAKAQSYAAGGLSLTAAAMNTVSIGMNSAAIVNNKKTIKNLNTMHDTLNEMSVNDKSVMDKKFGADRLATKESITALINKAKCLNSVYSSSTLDGVIKNSGDSFFLKDDIKVELPGGHLAVRNTDNAEQQDVMSCNNMTVETYIKGFASYDTIKSKFVTGCRWIDMNGENYYKIRSKTIQNDESTVLLQSAVDAIDSSFDEVIRNGVLRGENKANAQPAAKINCDLGQLRTQGITE